MTDGPVRITQPLLDVLDVLLAAEVYELHGWAIMKATGRSAPTIYKMLERLAEAEWVTSRWGEEVEPGRPRRRYYRLTGYGAAQARTLVEQRRRLSTRPARSRPAFGCGAA